MLTQHYKEKYWRVSLIIILLILGLLIINELQEFISGVLGAVTLYVLQRKQLFYLTEEKKIRPVFVALLLTTKVILLILIPLLLFSLVFVDKVSVISFNPYFLFEKINQFIGLIEEKTNLGLLNLQNLSFIPKWGIATVQELAQGIYSLSMNSFVLIFVLYFLFLDGRAFENFLWDLLPFKQSNKQHIVHEAYVMIRANAIGIPLLAIIQGGFSYIGYWFFDVDHAFLFAILTGLISIIPLLGTGLVWIPISIFLMINADYYNGAGLLLYGIIVIGNVDNLFRFLLQKKLADVHPLITILGVFLGLKFFGFWGVIFGPLILSLFVLLLGIYRKEYLTE